MATGCVGKSCHLLQPYFVSGEGDMITQQVECDICKALKKEVNHWYVVCPVGSSVRLHTWSSADTMGLLRKPRVIHCCGQACLHKALDQWVNRKAEVVDVFEEKA
jgi:hypothetical protein